MKRILGCLAGAILAGSLFEGGAAAAPIELSFLPPALPTQKICVSKRSDSQFLGDWKSWDRVALPRRAADSVIRDARRLRDLDAAANFEIVDRMFALLPTIDPQQKLQDIAVERINLHLNAGKLRELKELGLVDQLVAIESTLSPRAMSTLAKLYMTGSVVARDEKHGLALLVTSAYGGNADALLSLAKMGLDGKSVENWNVEPDLAIIMAFGALVGKLDDAICDRVGRIAREYERGEIVVKNPQIAEQWYRMAADLGDGSAAWKVASLHLESEDIDKDNEILLRYLEIAAKDGIVSAKIELGRIYETGALAAQDMSKATAYYREAGQEGSRSALIRLALMMQRRGEDVSERVQFIEILNQLAATADPPGWVYSKLARIVLEEQGRWGGETKAVPLLEKGSSLHDPDSMSMLAAILTGHRGNAGDFQRGVELLSLIVETVGRSDPMTDLGEAYLCRAPEGPDKRLADLWHDTDTRTGNKSLVMRPDDIKRLDRNADPVLVATLQTQALYGRPKSVAYYVDYLKRQHAPQDEIEFWRARAAKSQMAEAAILRLANEDASGAAEKAEILAGLKRLSEAGHRDVGIDYGQIVLDNFPEDAEKVAAAKVLLRDAAKAGFGKALWLLADFEPTDPSAPARIYSQFADVIAARGDTPGLLFAAGVTADFTMRSAFLNRAVGVMTCDFDSSLYVAEGFAGAGDAEQTEQWLDIGEHLAKDNAWRYVTLADKRLKLQGEKSLDKVIALYMTGFDMGEDSATSRLLKIYANKNSTAYSPKKAALMFKTALAQAQVEEIPALLQRISKATPAIREIIAADIKVSELYRRPAEAGNTIAMREFGRLVRAGATEYEAASATKWFKLAADKGDPESMVELAKAYAFGVGLQPSIEEAATWLKVAAQKGNIEAQQLLATMVPPNSVTQ